ncbi:FadR/GntR family transcriptional regulator [Corynebacterium sp. CCM 9203]|uniref:FadR/GntR family transcriptional regulator n=1 Tax=Corynebacterium sp. CCM 9203 TaxID=3057615 RepID=UPI003523EC06
MSRTHAGDPGTDSVEERPVGRSVSRARAQVPNRKDATSEAIKQFILDNQLRPGDPLPGETSLAEALDVSRSSVREALRRLEALDIVIVRRGAGSFVGALSMSPLVEALIFKATLSAGGDLATLREVVRVRRFLDLGMAETLCGKLRGTNQPGLTALVHSMVDSAERGETFSDADLAFHDGLLALAGNEVVRQLVSSFWQIHQAVVPTLGLAVHEGLVQTAHAHGDMLEAAMAGDVRAYERAARDHYRPLEMILDNR